MSLQSKRFWERAWIHHIENYLNAPPRFGYWLATHFSSHLHILEIAGGSCRDSKYLADLGWRAIGSDFDDKTIEYLRARFANSKLELRVEDAFALSLPDNSVDISVHNGFWVLYRDNDKLKALLREQARVTRTYIVAAVHNARNRRQILKFKAKSLADPLFDIRFFDCDELATLIRDSGIEFTSMKFHKFGGIFDTLYQETLKGFKNPFLSISKYVVPRLYSLQSWEYTERIVCVIELNKVKCGL